MRAVESLESITPLALEYSLDPTPMTSDHTADALRTEILLPGSSWEAKNETSKREDARNS